MVLDQYVDTAEAQPWYGRDGADHRSRDRRMELVGDIEGIAPHGPVGVGAEVDVLAKGGNVLQRPALLVEEVFAGLDRDRRIAESWVEAAWTVGRDDQLGDGPAPVAHYQRASPADGREHAIITDDDAIDVTWDVSLDEDVALGVPRVAPDGC